MEYNSMIDAFEHAPINYRCDSMLVAFSIN